MLENLLTADQILHDLWNRLHLAIAQADHPFHTPVVAATNEIDGVTARTVVLRKADRNARSIVFHTDRRSPKFMDLLQDPTVAWLFYDPVARLQLRIRTRSTLHTQDAVAHEQWMTLDSHQQEIYRTVLPPGTILETLSTHPPKLQANGRDHFAVVVGHIETIDWLYLHPIAHRRARFTWSDQHQLCEWLVA